MIFSVIVPVYNVEDYLEKCIKSILSQTFDDFELILVNDGSTDSSLEICQKFKNKDDRVKVFSKENGGLVSTRNYALKRSKGDYICYVDGDDWIEQDMLDKIYRLAIKNYSPDIVTFGSKKVFSNSEEVIDTRAEEGFYNRDRIIKEILPYFIYDSNQKFCKSIIYHSAWNKIYKRSLLLNHYCRETRIRMGEDSAFTFECIYYAQSLYIIKDVFYMYNQTNTSSMVHLYDKNRFLNNSILLKYISNNLGKKSTAIDQQLNALKVYWLIMAVFHEVKSERELFSSSRHIKKMINENNTLSEIKLSGLPMFARIFVLLLRLHLYKITLVLSAVINRLRTNNKKIF